MTHQIKIEDFEDFSFEYQLAGAFGRGQHKKLVVLKRYSTAWGSAYFIFPIIEKGSRFLRIAWL